MKNMSEFFPKQIRGCSIKMQILGWLGIYHPSKQDIASNLEIVFHTEIGLTSNGLDEGGDIKWLGESFTPMFVHIH